ncbi:hypothetical protein K443DRAFT_7702 [Laccaria amethystina LaAM-08-1]|uniref:Uncharacterized protein n=1 Tax=Laccaria amethystina LaAM-08-1 TaxID=1095629 RepID=A0A0C9WQB9_9AGAR|nr:hypothetical protein K443DRAFT_7702 [Laccaria amethystina LaAM-08-1]
MLEDVAPPQEQLRTPYDVHATGFPPDPRRSQFAGVGLYTLVFGLKQRCWALDIEVLGHTRWCWVMHTGIGFETSGLFVHIGIRVDVGS